MAYARALDATWIAMTAALVEDERVEIIVYDATEEARVRGFLSGAGVPLADVGFHRRRTDDCWVRDNGPIFVHGPAGEVLVTDWGFDGWGQDAPFVLDDGVPAAVATTLGVPRVDVGGVVLEGGAIEVDGAGTLMATRSSVFGDGRNPGLTEAQVEAELTRRLGIVNFLWLDGTFGGQLDITDTQVFALTCWRLAGVLGRVELVPFLGFSIAQGRGCTCCHEGKGGEG